MDFFFPLSKEIEKLRLELSESTQQVEQEQQKAARARQECLQVTELLGESERQLHLTRYALITLCAQHSASTGFCHRLPTVVTLVVQFTHSSQAYYGKWRDDKQNSQTRE